MVGLAVAKGVDFNLLDPAGRDGDLFLSLALRYQGLQDERAVSIEGGRQTLALLGPVIANASNGRRELFGVWDKALRRLEDDVFGVRRTEADDRPVSGSVDAMREAYRERFGDPNDPEFVEYDRAVAAWYERGGDLKGEPMPVKPGATVAHG